MLFMKNELSKTITSQHILNNLNEYIIKIDYFDQKGIKDFENNIPLNHIFNSIKKSPKTKTDSNYF